MPNQTTNLSLYTFLENEAVDWEQINDNFEKIDDLVVCYQSGTITSSYTGGTSANATWRYKKYTDGTIELSTKLEFDNLKCNAGTGPYYSGSSTLNIPVSLSSIYDTQLHLASNSLGWINNITAQSVLSAISFRFMCLEYETSTLYKQVFVNVKGVLV